MLDSNFGLVRFGVPLEMMQVRTMCEELWKMPYWVEIPRGWRCRLEGRNTTRKEGYGTGKVNLGLKEGEDGRLIWNVISHCLSNRSNC